MIALRVRTLGWMRYDYGRAPRTMSDVRRRELSLVVPAFQEGAHLYSSISRIRTCAQIVSSSYEIIIVDDGSTDDTWEQVERLCKSYGEVRGLRFSRNFGKDSAICAGLAECVGDAALILDADLQHPPELIRQFYDGWKEGFDVIEGVKTKREGEPLLRRIASAAFNSVATRYTGIHFANSSDFKLLDRKVIEAWLQFPERRVFFRGMVSWMGFRHKQIDFQVSPRVHGQSKWPALGLCRLALSATISFSSAPLRITHLLAGAFLVFSLVLSARALYLKAIGYAVSGFTTVIIVLLITGGMLLMIFGIIAEYLAAIYEELKGRPRYFVADAVRGADWLAGSVGPNAGRECLGSRMRLPRTRSDGLNDLSGPLKRDSGKPTADLEEN